MDEEVKGNITNPPLSRTNYANTGQEDSSKLRYDKYQDFGTTKKKIFSTEYDDINILEVHTQLY